MDRLTGVAVRHRVARIEAPRRGGVAHGELRVRAGLDHLTAVHEDARVRGVGDDEAVEAPFAAHDAADEVVGAADPRGTDAVEGRHEALAGANLAGGVLVGAIAVLLKVVELDVTDLHAGLERPEVQLTGGLLVHPRGHGVLTVAVAAVVLLLVEGEMLHHRVDALLGGALDLLGGHRARKEAVLGEILAVAAGVRRAVDIHGRGIPAGGPAEQALVADHVAQAVSDLLVPGLRHGHGVAERHACAAPAPAARGIGVGAGGLAHGLDVVGAVAGVQDHGLVVVGRELVKKVAPLRIVVVQATQVDELEAVARPVGELAVPALDVGIARVGGVELGQKVRRGNLAVGVAHAVLTVDLVAPGGDLRGGLAVVRGERALPVGAGEVGHVAAGIGELVLDLLAGEGVGGIGGRVHVGVCGDIGVDQGLVAGGIGAGGPLGGEHVVHGVVGVMGSGDVVGAGVQDVGARALRVIGLELGLVEGHGNLLALSGLEELGLCVAHELHGALLHAVGAVVVGVGALGIELHDVAPGHVAGVLDRHRGGAGLAGPARLETGPVKGGVGEAVAERIADLARVVEVARVALAEDDVLVAGLVVAVPDVDALLVAHVVVLGEVTGLVEVLVVAKVLRGRALARVGGIGVHGAARGVDLAGEDAGEGLGAVRAGRGHDEDGLDVREIGEPVELDGGVRVDHQNGVVEVVIEVLQDLELGRVGLEVALGAVLGAYGMVVHGARHVAALARHALEHEDGRGVLHGVQHAGVAHDGERTLVDGEVLVVAVAHRAGAHDVVLALAGHVEVREGLVDREARGLHGRRKGIGAAALDAKRGLEHGGSLHAQVARVAAHEGERRARLEWERAVVLQQYVALAGNVLVEGLLRLGDGAAVVVGLVVREVEAVSVRLGVVPALLHAEVGVDDLVELGQHGVRRHDDGHERHREHRRDDDAHDALDAALVLLCVGAGWHKESSVPDSARRAGPPGKRIDGPAGEDQTNAITTGSSWREPWGRPARRRSPSRRSP